jgi:prepilin-type N-terminal cleavage/methylation domain-containing protein
MKTNHEMQNAECGMRIGKNNAAPFDRSFRPPPSALRPSPAFTLIELLTVIGIIGALAAMLLAVAGPVRVKQKIFTARAEMERLVTAIDRYKATYGFYPPDNQVQADSVTNRFRVPQLYYELTGTTNINSNPADPTPVYQSLDNPSLATLKGGPGGDVQHIFGVGGFMNCSKPGGGEDAGTARNFLPGLKPKQVWNDYTNHPPSEPGVTLLVTSVGGPDDNYQPLGQQDLNPWRYNSSNPTNNPGAYDLWVQLVTSKGKTNLICNWTKQVLLNTPLP